MSEMKPDFSSSEKLADERGFSGYMIYFDHVNSMYLLLNDTELGIMNRALYEFAKNAKEPDLDKLPPNGAVLWSSMRQAVLDGFTHCYDSKCRHTWNALQPGLRKQGEPTDDEAKRAFERRYADENAHMYIRTNHFQKLMAVAEAKQKMLEAKKKLKSALSTGRREIDPEDLPPVLSAALNPHEAEEDSPPQEQPN